MKIHQDIASLFLRIALSAGFLSAVASRLGWWGIHSSGWENFLVYTAQVNSFVPRHLVPVLAVTSTLIESILGIMLLIGCRTTIAAIGTFVLTLTFALAMSISFGVKEPLDYSVFVCSASGLLLATLPHHRWSIDTLFTK